MANIWILNHYASTPDQPMTGPFDLAKAIVRGGHRVTIFASSFSHYKFEEMHLHNGEKKRVEECDEVRFIWIKTLPYWHNDWRRVLNMIGYAWRAFWVGVGIDERPDVIVGVTIHPLAALSGYLLSVFKKARFILEVRDLWPLTLVQFGVLRETNPVVWMMKALESFLFQKAEKIIMVWPHIDDYASPLGIPREKFVWIPQGIDLSRYQILRPYDGKRSNPFIVMYLGGHVNANALDVVLRAAQIQQNESDNNVQFKFVGGGQEKDNLVKLSKDLELRNVEFRDVVPRSELFKVMGEADAFVFSLRNLPIYRYGISFNKICDYLISGRPILFAGNPRYDPIKKAGAGLTVPPENPRALAEGIRELILMTDEERVQMGKNGVRYVREHHDVRKLALKFEQLLH